MSAGTEGDWYYVGQYGEIGPLSLEQMSDLVQDKVVEHDTFVWRRGMTDWIPAVQVSELSDRLKSSTLEPPPPPPKMPATPARPAPAAAVSPPAFVPSASVSLTSVDWHRIEASLPVSDKTRTTAGLLNFVPGAGRLYLGYAAHGVLQILLIPVCGVGLIWAWIDAIYILSGGVKFDGYGRVLKD